MIQRGKGKKARKKGGKEKKRQRKGGQRAKNSNFCIKKSKVLKL